MAAASEAALVRTAEQERLRVINAWYLSEFDELESLGLTSSTKLVAGAILAFEKWQRESQSTEPLTWRVFVREMRAASGMADV